jgi:hypothetical protein
MLSIKASWKENVKENRQIKILQNKKFLKHAALKNGLKIPDNISY